LGAVVQQPPHLVGHAAGAGADALADAYRRHRPRLPTASAASSPWEPACELPVLGQAWSLTWSRPEAGASPVGHGGLVAAGDARRRVSTWPGTAGAVLVG
jgi:hypothetical protein